MRRAFVIGLLGAESTGKTTLAAGLAATLRAPGCRVAVVPEFLREFCDVRGRTPRADEQRAIAAEQTHRIDAAAQEHDVVVADTTALMIAVYSDQVFGDTSLYTEAQRDHARCELTLLTALDLPWQADGLQRDGPHVREPVDQMLRELLIGHQLPWALVGGQGQARLEAAVDAVAPLLRPAAQGRGGLFTRLAERNAEPAARRWRCENCDDPACEHRLLTQPRY